ncbi:hypothetical protein [Paracoccus aminophilus]|uniref:hypothetical protein n=1 Tax=Paracoccus aminophilus TaxID=34003 RepID=UPI00059F7475|nr:hypothetical protein [Paracoccus aminophilus]
MAPLPETADQWAAATRVVLGLLRLQTEQPGAIDLGDMPRFLQMAADERNRHGDFGAARMLESWARKLTKPVDEWED